MEGWNATDNEMIGKSVTFVDPVGNEHPAIITACWGKPHNEELGEPSLNLVYVSENPSEHDQYGRQIKRVTSIVHQSRQFAHGNYWC